MVGALGFDGLASGLKTTDLITKIMETERKPVTMLQEKKDNLKTKADAWRDVNMRLFNLRNTVSSLQSSLTFKGRQVKLSDNDALGAVASTNALEGNYSIEVLSLAKAQTVTSDAQTSANTSLNYNGIIKLNGKEIIINEADTLNSLADTINNIKDIGINAAVIQTGTNSFKLTLTSKESGIENQIVLEDDPDSQILSGLGILTTNNENNVQFKNEVQQASNAVLKINGVTVERASNKINDVIQGVELDLKKEQTGSPIQLGIEVDLNKVVDTVKAFVEQYNSTMGFIKDNLAYDHKTKIKGKLFSDSSLIMLQSQLRSFLSRTVSGVDPSVNQLSLIGVSTGRPGIDIDTAKSGNLILDESKLRDKLKTNFDDVAKLFGAAVTNVAASKNGATVVASSQLNDDYSIANIINGETTSTYWGNGGGWSDGTPNEFPDSVEISLARKTAISQLNIYTIDSEQFPAANYGIKDFDVEYWDSTSASWKLLQSVTGNNKGLISNEFSAVVTDKVRINIQASNGANDHSRLIEVEVLEAKSGIFSEMYGSIFEWTKSNGAYSEKAKSFDKQMSDIDKSIERMQKRLEDRESYYYKRFIAMEQALSKIQSQSNWLSTQLAAFNQVKSEK